MPLSKYIEDKLLKWLSGKEPELAGMLVWDPHETSDWPAWREVDVDWLDRQAWEWKEEGVPSCSEAAARASGALRLSENEAAVKIMCGAEADSFEEAALSISPDAVIENIDGDDVVVMPTAETHASFMAWCAEHVSWD